MPPRPQRIILPACSRSSPRAFFRDRLDGSRVQVDGERVEFYASRALQLLSPRLPAPLFTEAAQAPD